MQRARLTVASKRKRRPLLRFPVLVLLLVGMLAFSIFQLEQKVRPVAAQIAAYQSRVLAVRTIQKACHQILTQQQELYEDLYQISRDDAGQIQSIESNTQRINLLEEVLVEEVNTALLDMGQLPLEIPVGTLSGLQSFSGLGPCVSVQAIPLSLASSEVHSRFTSAGINQTQMDVSIHFTVTVGAVLAGFTESIQVEADFTVAQILIVGQVPQVYAQTS